MPSPLGKPSSIVIGYNQILSAESLLAGEPFSLSLFESFNQLVEGVVLYDDVLLLGKYPLDGGCLFPQLHKSRVIRTIDDDLIRTNLDSAAAKLAYSEAFNSAFGESAIVPTRLDINEVLSKRLSPTIPDQISYSRLFEMTISCSESDVFDVSRMQAWMRENVLATEELRAHTYYLARSIAYGILAQRLNADYSPDLLRLPIAALMFGNPKKRPAAELYAAVAEKTRSEIEAMVACGMPVRIFVPPISAYLLSKVDDGADYISELMTLRERFSNYRKAYREFQSLLDAPDVSLKEKAHAKKVMVDQVQSVIERGPDAHSITFRTIWEKLVSSTDGADGVSTKLSISGAVSLILEAWESGRRKQRAKALFDLWSHTINLKTYGSLLERRFGASIDEHELRRMTAYSTAVSKIISRDTQQLSIKSREHNSV